MPSSPWAGSILHQHLVSLSLLKLLVQACLLQLSVSQLPIDSLLSALHPYTIFQLLNEESTRIIKFSMSHIFPVAQWASTNFEGTQTPGFVFKNNQTQ